MKKQAIRLEETGYFSKLFLDYLQTKEQLSSFYSLPPTIESFASQIQNRKFDQGKRSILHEALTNQYKDISNKAEAEANIGRLQNSNCYTVTTGHQLNIFGGPLYFIYKIVTVINLAKKLNDLYPECDFVPVFWMASEDHDLEEINNFSLFNKKHTWETSQKGAVGRMNLEGIENIFSQISEKLPLFEEAYKWSSLSNATRFFVNELFGKHGLVVVDGDDKSLKTLFKEVVKTELTEQVSFRCIAESSAKLSALGYNLQVNPREINLFYLEHGLRERIVLEGQKYRVLNTELEFTKDDLLKLVDDAPERFSPNVVLRPLYQETILPNLTYTGGPAESDYWLQLKSMFDFYKVPFPIIIPRNFVLYLNKVNEKKLKKAGITERELFLSISDLKQAVLKRISGEEISLDQQLSQLDEVFDAIITKAIKVDGSLEGYVKAEKQKTLKSFDEILKRLKKAEEKKNEDVIRQAEGIKDKLFPNGSLQERHDNFLNFYINDNAFVDKVVETLDPMDFSFNILSENEEG